MAYQLTRTPPSSRAFRLDNNARFSSNASDEPLQSISVSDSYSDSMISLAKPSFMKEPAMFHPPNRHKSQSQNQAPRYRTSSNDSMSPNATVERRMSPSSNRSSRQRPVYTQYNSDLAPAPPFLSNATKSSSTLRSFSNPYLPKRPLSQSLVLSTPRTQSHYKIYESQLFWLGLYFAFNLGLTLFNKGVLIRFPFPYTLTALHALCGTVGGYALLENDVFIPARLGGKETGALVAFSVLYAVNIVVSNMSLHLVTVPFHQVVRASTPIFTIALSALLFGASSSPAKMMSLIPVIIGVALATYGDYYFTTWGLILTLLGTFLASLKTIYTHILQSRTPLSTSTRPSTLSPYLLPPRLQLHPLDLLTRMAPLAFIQCVCYAYMSGELDRVRHWSSHEMTFFKAGALGTNGVLAFGLNVVSFTANRKAGALSMTVAGNVKQVLTILFAVTLFDLTITRMNALGILLTLLGGVWYAVVDYQEKRR